MKVDSYLYVCGTPKDQCSGALTIFNASIGKTAGRKTHASHKAAFACTTAWLSRLGWKQHGHREFENPESGAIRVLTKPSHFGARVRPGKEGTRAMPCKDRAGLIISC